MPRKSREEANEYARKYRQTAAGKATALRAMKKYRTTEEGKATSIRSNRKQREKFPVRATARDTANNAQRSGRLVKPDTCEVEGCKETKLQKHHEDHSKPLEVNWLCKPHHDELTYANSDTN